MSAVGLLGRVWRGMLAGVLLAHIVVGHCATAPAAPAASCPRPAPGSPVVPPRDLSSRSGVLRVDLAIRNAPGPGASARYCYVTADGSVSPTLRLHPGDELVLHLTNALGALDLPEASLALAPSSSPSAHASMHDQPPPSGADPCTSGAMNASATNLHFHGLSIAARCHQDEVLRTSVQPGDPPFEYRFRIPPDQPPGLYWYHPHIHGHANAQVLGGASGALIVEGLERAIPELAGLAQQVLVIRDQPLLNPDASPSSAEPVVPRPILDSDGDVANNNTGYGRPARDLSVNFVPVPYPDYPPARIFMQPRERQLWRVLNASAITYLHLTLLYDKRPQALGIVAIDGVPVNFGDASAPHVKTVDHYSVPPGSRVEFIVEGPAPGVAGLLITRMVDTGQDGENVPNRPLAAVTADAQARVPRLKMPLVSTPLPPPARPWLGSVEPSRVRKLYFSEQRKDPADPQSPIAFFITVDGAKPAVFDPAASTPDIVVKQGDVEDWIIENRSLELHAFHIHQLHFQLREWFGYEVDEPFLRDTVSVPYFDNHMTAYPSVRLRMDFRDPNTVGTFLFHCHLLEHEDGGMMGTIRVDPADPAVPEKEGVPKDPETQLPPARPALAPAAPSTHTR
jgi:FtsP/CotA-like multicopper oxidase with cupredoxin domain